MAYLKSYLYEVSEEIYENIPKEVTLETGTYELTELSEYDLEKIVDYAVNRYVDKVYDVVKQEMLEESKMYLRELVIEQILN
jgi:hypothetical protein